MKILRLKQVEEATGLKRTAIYERMNAEKFPKVIKLGPQARGWLDSEVNAWLAERVAERDAG